MEIRLMGPTDIESVIKGEEATLGETLGKEFFEQELTNPLAYFWVATKNDEVIGYIGAYVVPPSADIISFYVLDAYQKQGYGSKLMTRLLDECGRLKVEAITLEVKEGNNKGINFYLKNGFQKINIRKHYYQDGSNALLMKKVIK